ncbi:potassium transporter TrkA [Amphritea opalescens]|uniref:Potassium transporter TrkA n=1 Tax=Amphritea opalescens TaxID=2490544 RepID=A0A430KQ79_9GAMM|nr:potassium channel protein [Amphritea opalescens]RTE65514.1 potassium transporter TrkA [Amphritea opalescens]
MNDIFYLMLRRLRHPLITLIVIYSVTILGFVMIPGQDDQGNVWAMDFFHAIYFVSFMGSTIGFGEIPYAFTSAQRAWTLVTIYGTVIAWLYCIGSLLALLQEPVFRRMLRRRSFANEVKNFNEPFYLICGYGITGSAIVEKLCERGIRSVIIDIDQDRIDQLEIDGLVLRVPGLCADASLPETLDDAGLQHPDCIGVLALTNDDNVNLSISIASKLLVPERIVVSRTESEVNARNLASFGTDHIIDPFKDYAEYLSLAAHAPYTHLVYDWLVNPFHRPLSSAYKQASGRWIICGLGRFGKALYREFAKQDVELVLLDDNAAQLKGYRNTVTGLGTEAATLQAAGINEAVGIIAGTHNDADNLSIIMTARELNPKLITVVRQNLNSNTLIYQNSKADFIMEPGKIIANRILAKLKTPLLPAFIEQMKLQDDVWAHTLLNRMSSVAGDDELDSWSITVSPQMTPAICAITAEGLEVKLSHLMKDPRHRKEQLPCFPLMFRRDGESKLLPGELMVLQEGDEILFCGLAAASNQMSWSINNYNILFYLQTGEEPSHNLLAKLLKRI